MTSLYAILDTGTPGSLVHYVVSINFSDPNNIRYVPFGIIKGLPDKYFTSAVFDPASGKIFCVLSDSITYSLTENIYLYSVSFPDLSLIVPFCVNNTFLVNINPQGTYNPTDKLFYYAINAAPGAFDYKIVTVDRNRTIVTTDINVNDIEQSNYGVQIYGNYIYASIRISNSFSVYYANIHDNSIAGAIESPIFPQPRGNINCTFDQNGVLWGNTQYAGSDPHGYSLYRLDCTQNGLPAPDSFPVELIGDMSLTFNNNSITNMTIFIAPPRVQKAVHLQIKYKNKYQK